LPLANVLYNKPVKSSALGGIKKLNLPLLAPLTAALAGENLLYVSIPV